VAVEENEAAVRAAFAPLETIIANHDQLWGIVADQDALDAFWAPAGGDQSWRDQGGDSSG
jgi:hypothetical protein